MRKPMITVIKCFSCHKLTQECVDCQDCKDLAEYGIKVNDGSSKQVRDRILLAAKERRKQKEPSQAYLMMAYEEESLAKKRYEEYKAKVGSRIKSVRRRPPKRIKPEKDPFRYGYPCLIGKVFSDLTVIEKVDPNSKAALYWCLCSCGTRVKKSAYDLVVKQIERCIKCSRLMMSKGEYKNFTRTMFKGDYERKVEFEIGDEDI